MEVQVIDVKSFIDFYFLPFFGPLEVCSFDSHIIYEFPKYFSAIVF